MGATSAVEVLCWLPDRQLEDQPLVIPVGHTGLRVQRTVYSFWPDHDGVENCTATPAPGDHADSDRVSHSGSILAHPAFLGGWIGLVLKETSSLNAERFLAIVTNAIMDPSASLYQFEGGVLTGPNVPRLAAYGLSVDSDCVQRLGAACRAAHLNPPEYSFRRHCFCTPLVAHTLRDAGVHSFEDAPTRRPEEFRKWLDRLSTAPGSVVAYKQTRTIGFRQGSTRVLDWVNV